MVSVQENADKTRRPNARQVVSGEIPSPAGRFSLHWAPFMSATLPSPAPSPLTFADGAPVAERLAACKAYLLAEGAALRARHEAGASGLELVHARAASMDAMLTRLFD